MELSDLTRRCSACGVECDVCLVRQGDISEEVNRILLQLQSVPYHSNVVVREGRVTNFINALSDGLTGVAGVMADGVSGVLSDLAGVADGATNVVANVAEFGVNNVVAGVVVDRGSNERVDLVKIMIVLAVVCLLFSLIIFLCVLDDKYCLIPASCLLIAGIVCSTVAVVLKRRERRL